MMELRGSRLVVLLCLVVFGLVGCKGSSGGGEYAAYTGDDGSIYVVGDDGEVIEGQAVVVQALE